MWIVLGQAGDFELWRVDLGLGLALTTHAGLVLADPLLGRLPDRARRRFLWVALELVAVVLLAELSLRALSEVLPRNPLVYRGAQSEELIRLWRPLPHARAHGEPLSSRGYRDEEIGPRRPGVPRVLVLGDSFCLGVVPHSHHYTTVAERRLGGVEVVNMGFPYLGPHEYRSLFESEGLATRPDLVVVSFFVGNDVKDGTLRRDPGDLSRRLFDRAACQLVRVATRLWRLRGGRLPKLGDPLAASGSGPLLGVQQAESLFPFLLDPLLEQPTFSESTFLDIEARRLRFLSEAPETIFDQALEPLVVMRDTLAPTPLVVLLIPDEFQVEDEVWEAAVVELGGGAFDRDRPQRLLSRLCVELGLPVVDLLPELRAIEPLADGRRHAYHQRDTHFNARGNRVVGERLAELIETFLGATATEAGRGRSALGR